MPRPGSIFRRRASTAYPARDVTVKRGSDNSFGFSVMGGIENNIFPTVHIGQDNKPNMVKGKLKNKDIIFAVNNQYIVGEPHSEVTQMLVASGQQVTLRVATVSDDKCAVSYLLKMTSDELDETTAELQTSVKRKLAEMCPPFTTRPPRSGEEDGVQFRFVSEPDFMRLVESGRMLEHHREDGHLYGTIIPTPEVASKQYRLSRTARSTSMRAALAGNVTASSSVPRAVKPDPNQSVQDFNDAEGDPDCHVQVLLLARSADGRLGFAFDGGIDYGTLLTVRRVTEPRPLIVSSTNRGLRVGDALVAVNGLSVVGCTVDEAEAMINKLPDPVELTTTCFADGPHTITVEEFMKVSDSDPEDIKAVKKDLKQDVYHLTIPYTTRPMREGEVDGKDYHFVSRQVFEDMCKSDKFIEWGQFDGVFYGSPHRESELNATFRKSEVSVRLRGKQIFRPSHIVLKRPAVSEPLGMSLMTLSNRVFINEIQAGSHAYDAKLRAGMEILSIDGQQTSTMSYDEILKDLNSKLSTELAVRYDPEGFDKASKAAAALPSASETKQTSKSKLGSVLALVAVASVGAAVAALYQYLAVSSSDE